MNKKLINYSQCWEDSSLLKEALSISEEDYVLSITSGGDNTLALLLEKPHKIVSLDLNLAQNYLLELKKCSAKSLSYNEYLEFLGVTKSKHRTVLFEKVKPLLSPSSRAWWLNHKELINQGVINCGRFERFTIFFARYILPLIHSRKIILKLISINDIEEQRNFYRDKWDSKRWRFLFGLASNRLMLKRFARQQGMFAHSEGQTLANLYLKRLERTLNSVLVKGNFYLHYSLTGMYGNDLPIYLEQKSYPHLQKDSNAVLSIETLDLLSYLKTVPDNTFSKFNLSDIFEALSLKENNLVWEEIIRTAKNNAVVAYWNNLVCRTCPVRLSIHIKNNEKQIEQLRSKDMVFFYDSFHVNTIIK
jgi:S-adenosylmethionine-diacylglycerol 3-amino-3-carboxypropyl transferase